VALAQLPSITLDTLAARIQGEYREMPGLRLTVRQACRLWQVDAATCEAVLDALVKDGFLFRTPDGAFLARTTTMGAAEAATPRRAFTHSA
jgi:hypothetical protein